MKYIELSSFYRNRNQYPHPSSFVSGSSDERTDLPIRTFQSTISDLTLDVVYKNPIAPTFNKPVGINYVISNGNEETIVVNTFSTNQVELRDKFSSIETCSVLNKSTEQSIWFPDGPNESNCFIGLYLFNKTIKEYRQIVAYKQNMLFLDQPYSNLWTNDDYYNIVKNKKPIYTIIGNNGNVITLDKTIPPMVSVVRLFNNDEEILINMSNIVNNTFTYSSSEDITGITDCMLYNTTENIDIVSKKSAQINSLTLQSIILPNLPLRDGRKIVDLPYIHVYVGNENQINSNLVSNNQQITPSFRVPILDTFDTDFVSLYSNVTTFNVFKPSDPIRLEVRLPDGQLFKNLQYDTLPPYEPNPDIQISCILGYEPTC
jgi:hypothetical protein